MQKDSLHGIIPATPRPASVMPRAWLPRSRYVAIENSITSIRVVASCTGLGQSTGEGITETVISWHCPNIYRIISKSEQYLF